MTAPDKATGPDRTKPGAAAPVPDRAWRRYAIEAFTIVFSVLLALALDALWDYRGDRVREREYLTGLAQEFRASARELEADQIERRRILDRVERLLEHARAGATDLPQDSLGPWLAAVLNYRYYTPVHSVLGDLTSSGNLGLLRSDTLRRELLEYEQERRRLAVIEERERDFVAAQIEPFLAGNLPLAAYLTLDVFDNDPEPVDPRVEPFRTLLRDPASAGLLMLRWERTDGARRFGAAVDRSIGRITGLLEAAPDD